MFDLARLEGGIIPFTFAAEGGGKITVLAHALTSEEIAVATMAAGMAEFADEVAHSPDKTADFSGSKGLEMVIKEAQMSVEMACLCIESIQGEGVEVPTVKHAPTLGGLRRLSPESQALFPRTILVKIGRDLNKAAGISEEENFPSEPQPTGDTTGS